MNPTVWIDALADRLAEAFIRALRPKLAALMDEQIDRMKASVGIGDINAARETIRRHIGL
jgi:hypothetical protein